MMILDAILYVIVFAVLLYLFKHAVRFYLKEEEKAEIRERGERWKGLEIQKRKQDWRQKQKKGKEKNSDG